MNQGPSPTRIPPRPQEPPPPVRVPTVERQLLRAGLYLALAWFGLAIPGDLVRGRTGEVLGLDAVGATVALAGLTLSARRHRDE